LTFDCACRSRRASEIKPKGKMKKMTLMEATALVKRAENLFERAAQAWVRGNNSGNGAKLEAGEKRCDKLRGEAEELLKPLGIKCDYPGLYPSFSVKGFGHHSVLSAVSAALEGGKS
jgi:hypothetical protein